MPPPRSCNSSPSRVPCTVHTSEYTSSSQQLPREQSCALCVVWRHSASVHIRGSQSSTSCPWPTHSRHAYIRPAQRNSTPQPPASQPSQVPAFLACNLLRTCRLSKTWANHDERHFTIFRAHRSNHAQPPIASWQCRAPQLSDQRGDLIDHSTDRLAGQICTWRRPGRLSEQSLCLSTHNRQIHLLQLKSNFLATLLLLTLHPTPCGACTTCRPRPPQFNPTKTLPLSTTITANQ